MNTTNKSDIFRGFDFHNTRCSHKIIHIPEDTKRKKGWNSKLTYTLVDNGYKIFTRSSGPLGVGMDQLVYTVHDYTRAHNARHVNLGRFCLPPQNTYHVEERRLAVNNTRITVYFSSRMFEWMRYRISTPTPFGWMCYRISSTNTIPSNREHNLLGSRSGHKPKWTSFH